MPDSLPGPAGSKPGGGSSPGCRLRGGESPKATEELPAFLVPDPPPHPQILQVHPQPATARGGGDTPSLLSWDPGPELGMIWPGSPPVGSSAGQDPFLPTDPSGPGIRIRRQDQQGIWRSGGRQTPSPTGGTHPSGRSTGPGSGLSAPWSLPPHRSARFLAPPCCNPTPRSWGAGARAALRPGPSATSLPATLPAAHHADPAAAASLRDAGPRRRPALVRAQHGRRG